MGFEKTVLAVAEDCGIDGAYFEYGTMFVQNGNVEVANIVKFQAVFPDTVVSVAGDEIAVDFVAPGQGRALDTWEFVTV